MIEKECLKVYLESLANRTPIIAFGAPGVEDIYQYAGSEEIGIKVEERNAESLLKALRKFRALDLEKYLEMCICSRRVVEDTFSDFRINEKLM